MRGLEDFNSPSYWWEPYFSDMGRALAAGEQSFLQEAIRQQVDADTTAISRSNPQFQALEQRIETLSQRALKPDIMLAPIELYVPFIQSHDSRIDWTGTPETVAIGGTHLSIFWSHKYAPSDCFIVFCSKGGTWRVVPDRETGQAITIALGQSALYPDRVEIGVETTVNYEVTHPEAFCVIGLSD